MISFEEFKKVELRVGHIISAEPVPGSEKLLRLHINIGEETPRQILAGIGKTYAPETLPNKQVVIVANLTPRMMMGHESQGMLLATGENPEQLSLVSPDANALPGAEVR